MYYGPLNKINRNINFLVLFANLLDKFSKKKMKMEKIRTVKNYFKY